MLKNGEEFHPYDFDELKNPNFKEQSSSNKSLGEEEAINYLRSLSYSVNRHESVSANE